MKENIFKYFFYILAASLLVIMIISSRSAGISCDEIIHYNHSVAVYNYFSSHGADTSALNTPVSFLKYYGQSYDNIVTILTRWLNIEDVYRFRNLMSAVMGWLTVLLTALFAVWLKDYLAGIIVIFLLAITPAFFGHSLNNLKDIPFAFAYITGIFCTLKFIFKSGKISIGNAILLTLSYAFCISIRAGGLILICYLFLFPTVFYFMKYAVRGKINVREIIRKLAWIAGMALLALLLSSLLWPYALQDPLRNILDSYKIMAHYPATFRQIFEGKVEWSDYMPWYYLLKSMAITIPVVVLAGLLIFILVWKKVVASGKALVYGFLIFTVMFPVVFVIIEKSNLYSSWRQFLFIYPGIIILAAAGFTFFIDSLNRKWLKMIVVAALIIFSVNPVSFMIRNHPYEYIYYNEFTGGLKGAYGNYETDYYYVSHTEAAEWLLKYLEENKINEKIKIQSTYSVDWLFRKHPEIETSFFRYEERSMHDWEYAIVGSRYISPYMLKNNFWPPKNAIHVIYADKVPLCAILKRKTKDDFNGFKALKEWKNKEAINYFQKAIQSDDGDEMIFYNFAAALYNDCQYQKADSVLKKGLEINPDSEIILMYLGNICKAQNKGDEAVKYYEKVIGINRKYFEAYVNLAELIADRDVMKARSLLRQCVRMNPNFKPAYKTLGDTYKNSHPDIAEKYYDKANRIN